LGGARSLPTRVTRRTGRGLEGTGRDDRPGLGALEPEDFVFEVLDAVLELADEIEQLPDQRRAFGFRDLRQRRGHGQILPTAELPCRLCPEFLRSYRFLHEKTGHVPE